MLGHPAYRHLRTGLEAHKSGPYRLTHPMEPYSWTKELLEKLGDNTTRDSFFIRMLSANDDKELARLARVISHMVAKGATVEISRDPFSASLGIEVSTVPS